MKELEVLLSKRWILKSRDKEMYYKLRDALGELRKFTTEKMGCQIIDNSLLIKMEKIPVIPESFMGIMKFSSKEEYAYLLSGDDCRMGSVFPGNNAISDILLLCFGKMRKKIENDEWKTAADESCCIDQIGFENLIKDVKKEYGSGFSKNYREMPEGEFVKSVIDEMEVWMFIRKDEADHQIKICPLTGKIQGSYPADYMGGRNDE